MLEKESDGSAKNATGRIDRCGPSQRQLRWRLMPIRFRCASCGQPIEVDDEHAQRLVACPYCRKTITAPAQSTLPDSETVPTASPLRGLHPMPGGQFPLPPVSVYSPGGSTNKLAVVAFVLACSLIGWLIAATVIASNHLLELEEIAKEIGPGGTMQDQWRVMLDFADRQGGEFPTWFVAIGLIYLLAMVTWLAALVCALIAVRRIPRRGLATAALVICALSFGLVLLAS